MRRELTFLTALWKANLLAAMEYRVSFISQVVGMILNDGVYFLFWVIFFDRFQKVRGWGLTDMFVLFGVVATGFGLGVFLFGNVLSLSEIISGGRLDYFLSMPRSVLVHVLASKCVISGLGDATYGVISFLFARQYRVDAILRFLVGSLLSMIIFLSFLVLVQSLSFWMGNSTLLSDQASNAIVTFSLYPITLFDGTAKLLLFTLIPAAFIGAIPAEFIRASDWKQLLWLLLATLIFLTLSIFAFHRGLRRYESGSAIQTQV